MSENQKMRDPSYAEGYREAEAKHAALRSAARYVIAMYDDNSIELGPAIDEMEDLLNG